MLEQVTGRRQADDYHADITPAPTHAPSKRVYMDEIKGPVVDFDGKNLTLQGEEEAYVFDLSLASVECPNGILGKDEVSVIYEGRLDDPGCHILKMADAFHKKERLKEYTLSGTLKTLTPWSITLVLEGGRRVTLPTVARPQYYSTGILTDMRLTLHCLGTLPPEGSTAHPLVLVRSISDTEPLKAPGAPPKIEAEITDPYIQTQKLDLTIEAYEGTTLKAKPLGSETVLSFDLTSIPCFFPTGILPGTRAEAYFTGPFNGNDLNGVSVSQIRGIESPGYGPTLTGTCLGHTLDTMTLSCPDGSLFTFRNRKKGHVGALEGESVTVTVLPSPSADTTIYFIDQ